MIERIGANGMPIKKKEEVVAEEDQMLSEILTVNPNKKKTKKEAPKVETYEWSAPEDENNEEL